MTSPIWANNATTTLAAAITNTATSLTLLSGSGALFANPSAGQEFSITLIAATNPNTMEIVYCTARSGDTCTIVRAQEGTTALAWDAGDTAANLVTEGLLVALANSVATLNATVATLQANLAGMFGTITQYAPPDREIDTVYDNPTGFPMKVSAVGLTSGTQTNFNFSVNGDITLRQGVAGSGAEVSLSEVVPAGGSYEITYDTTAGGSIILQTVTEFTQA